MFIWTAGDIFGIAFFLLVVLGVGIYYLANWLKWKIGRYDENKSI